MSKGSHLDKALMLHRHMHIPKIFDEVVYLDKSIDATSDESSRTYESHAKRNDKHQAVAHHPSTCAKKNETQIG